ncbi:MAG: arylsulfotransferase family protein [Chloroflexi bacterium]|nr:arylsulfotransferase family protein [Chloroflexota bacterium]
MLDYVIRCGADGHVQVNVASPPATTVSVDGGPERSGAFSASVPARTGQSFALKVVEPAGRVTNHSVRCLALDFPAFTAQRDGPTQAQWYVVAPFSGAEPAGTSLNYVGIFDANGVPVWWYRAATRAADAKLLANGNLVWARVGGGSPSPPSAEEHRLDGTVVRTVGAIVSGSDHHEVQLLANGNYLLARYYARSGVDLTACGGPADGAIYDNELQEIDAEGQVVWSWNASDHIPVSEVSPRWRSVCAGTGPADVYHFNSAEPDADGLVLSLRHLDAVLRIRRDTGAIDWKLGGTARPERLVAVGDPALSSDGFGGQHDARVLADGTLTVHDNGSSTARPPRAVRYRIDRSANTATLLEDVRDAAATVSPCCGSARRLAGGNWVTSWGRQPFVSELTPAGSPVFRLTFTQGLFSYRADPVPFGRLSATTLRSAMDSMHPRAGP